MSLDTLRIATRKSPLALYQAEHVAEQLRHYHPKLNIELVTFTTQGDVLLESPLSKIGGKGLFVKELEQALLDQRADIAVHSMKDVPAELPEGLCLSAVLKRESALDALVSTHYQNLDDLPANACIGTCSLRRQAQLLAINPNWQIKSLRGNVGTRLAKLDQGEFDAIILAAAGLNRLQLSDRIQQELPAHLCLPAAGQGIMGIEQRENDAVISDLLRPLMDTESQTCLSAERRLSEALGGSCQMPLGAYAELHGELLYLRGLLASPDGQQLIKAESYGAWQQAHKLGETLAQQLLAAGGHDILLALGVTPRI